MLPQEQLLQMALNPLQEVTRQLQLPIQPILPKDLKLPPGQILQPPQLLLQEKQMEEKQPQVLLPVQILQHQQTIRIPLRLQTQPPLPILPHHGLPHDKKYIMEPPSTVRMVPFFFTHEIPVI
jgi:hypothetical protein